MAYLGFIGTREEYRDFLETRYRDGTWSNPLCAWVMDWFEHQEDRLADSIYMDGPHTIFIDIKTGDYYDSGGHDGSSYGHLTVALPAWAATLAQHYWDETDGDSVYTRVEALAHLAAYISVASSEGMS